MGNDESPFSLLSRNLCDRQRSPFLPHYSDLKEASYDIAGAGWYVVRRLCIGHATTHITFWS